MKHIRNRNILELPGIESWRNQLSEKKVEMLEKSWAGTYREHVTPHLPVEKLACHYSDDMGRKTKELITVMGTILLQQVFDLTDEQTRDQLAFNQQWHYALDTFRFEEQVIGLKTLWNVRNIMVKGEIASDLFRDITDRFSDVFNVDTHFQRIDSTHINSNMAKIGRVRLVARAITKFIKNLKRGHENEYNSKIPQEIKDRYEDEKGTNYFGKSRPSNSRKRLQEVCNDLYYIIERFKYSDEIKSMYSYKLMERIFGEHCRIDEGKVVVIPSKEVSSDSIQNPSDIDATYDGYKGQGYQAQIMETYTVDKKESDSEDVEERDKDAQLNLITYAEAEPAHNHDSNALEPAIEEVESQNLKPEELSGDTHYGSEKNMEYARDNGVELIAPQPGKVPQKDMSEFKIDTESLEIIECLMGEKPYKVKYNKKGTVSARWSKQVCGKCKYRGSCPIKEGKKDYILRYKKKEIKCLLRRQYESSEEFIEKYRYRAGIEGTNSYYKRKTGVEYLRYRGLEKVIFAVKMKALGINIFRAVNYCRKMRKREEINNNIQPDFCLDYLLIMLFSAIINFFTVFRERSENRLVYCH